MALLRPNVHLRLRVPVTLPRSDLRAHYFAFGNLAIDDLVFADGTTLWGRPGGGALYAALGMALWSDRAAVVAPLGADYPRERFAAIDFSHSRAIVRTLRNWGLYETDGSRHFLARRDSQPWEAFTSKVRELDAGPYAYCHLAPMPRAQVTQLLIALRERGARIISLDFHDRELAALGIDALLPVLANVDIFLPSEQEMRVLFPDRSAREALRALRARLPGVPVIGVKCGAAGAIVHAAGSAQIVAVPSAAERVVDATGAGDAFCGGFLAGYARCANLVEAAVCGAVSAAFAVQGEGPAGFTTVEPGAAEARCAALRRNVEAVAFDAP